jgi:hypothetical protein
LHAGGIGPPSPARCFSAAAFDLPRQGLGRLS